jgi:hypothetical protein
MSAFYYTYKNQPMSLVVPTCSFLTVTLVSFYCALAFCVSGVHCFWLLLFVFLMKAMVRCSPLSEVVVTNGAEAENLGPAHRPIEMAQTIGEGEMSGASDDEGCGLSDRGTDDYRDGGASDDEKSWTYYFGASTITLGKIKEMVEKGYFTESEAQVPGAEAVPELDNDEAMVYEHFFVAGLCMPLHATLGDILLHFQAQLHQLTPNDIAQLSKYFWAIGSFRGMPSSDAFVK